MSQTTGNKASRTVVASIANAAGGTKRGTVDLRSALGGLLTLKITNGATGPTQQCIGRVLVAHDEGVTPAAASAGAAWKTVWEFGGGVSANAVTEESFDVGAAVMHLEVEFAGNTGQGVTVEAYLSELSSLATV